MPNNIYRIPQVVIDKKNENANTQLDATNFKTQLYPYDGFDEITGTGFSSKEGFISTILSDPGDAPIYDISLNPSKTIPTTDFSIGAKYIRNITNYNQKEDDAATLIYSQERPVYRIETELDIRDKLVFFTQESIYGDQQEIDLPISKDTPVFLIDSYDPTYDGNDVFQYATLTLKRLVSFKARRQNNTTLGNTFEYIQFNFFRANIQPVNAVRRKRTYRSKPWIWFSGLTDSNNLALDWNYTPNTQGKPFITPILPRKIGGTKLNFSPSWINEMGYWNANYDKWGGEQKGGIFGGFDSGDTEVKSNGRPTNSKSFNPNDITPPKGLITNTPIKYKWWTARYSILSGTGSERDNLFKGATQTLDFSPPFNFMGFIYEEIRGLFGSATLSRPEDTEIAVWKTWEDQSYAVVDALSNEYDVILTKELGAFYSQIKLNPNRDINNYNIIAQNIIKGNAVMFGQTINLRPPSSYIADFDFNPNPENWSVEEIKKYTGVFWFDEDVQLDGSSIELQLPAITPDDLPSDLTEQFPVSNFANTWFRYKYGSSQLVKQRLPNRDWYVDYNENWVVEQEWSTPSTIIADDEKFFGGYEYVDEWFENSYADSLINGDIPCKFVFEGTEYNLPPLTYRAPNRRGNPLALGEDRIWGTGGAFKERNTLIRKNIKDINNNKKKVINIKTGDKIKNIHYKK